MELMSNHPLFNHIQLLESSDERTSLVCTKCRMEFRWPSNYFGNVGFSQLVEIIENHKLGNRNHKED